MAFLKQSSAYYRQEGLDPKATLSRVPLKFRKLTAHEQLKLEYPVLNDRQINAYVRLQEKQATQSVKSSRSLGQEWEP